MKHLRKHFRKDKFTPVCLQMIKVCILSCLVTGTLLILMSYLDSYSEDEDIQLMYTNSALILFLYFGIAAAILVPIEILMVLIIHYAKIWPFFMYSKILTIMVASQFTVSFFLLNRNSRLPLEYNMILSCLPVICIFILIRLSFPAYFVSFQKDYIDYYDGRTMDLKSDTFITLILCSIGISISLFISLVIL